MSTGAKIFGDLQQGLEDCQMLNWQAQPLVVFLQQNLQQTPLNLPKRRLGKTQKKGDTMENVQWKVEGMDCASCALTIHKYLEKKGMKDVKVNAVSGDVSFQM